MVSELRFLRSATMVGSTISRRQNVDTHQQFQQVTNERISAVEEKLTKIEGKFEVMLRKMLEILKKVDTKGKDPVMDNSTHHQQFERIAMSELRHRSHEESARVVRPLKNEFGLDDDVTGMETCTDPIECDSVDPPVAGWSEVMNREKDGAVALGTVATPVDDGAAPIVGDKPRSSFSSWSSYQKQNPSFNNSTPWCKLLSHLSQNPNVSISSSYFTIGSSKHCNFPMKDPSTSAILCKIKNTQREGISVAMLENMGSTGSVEVNGTAIKKNTSFVLNSGNEVVFSMMGNYVYIFQQIMTEFPVTIPSTLGNGVKNSLGKILHLEKWSSDPSSVDGVLMLASTSGSEIHQEMLVMALAKHFEAKLLLCGDRAVKGEVSPEDGVFACNSFCGKKLNCGNHVCNDICHPGPCGECDLIPGKSNTCCCGKISLQGKRKSCFESIPTCENICGKMLPCGIHRCKEVCHSGECPPCLVPITQKCPCGSTSRTVECYKTTGAQDTFLCEKPCGRKKNCGGHGCSEKCCIFSDFNNTHNGDCNSHFCSMSCGKKLRCRQHLCESYYHSGHCPPCLETIFTDLTCSCGKTLIPPPQPCGHSSSHSCHFGDRPPCSIPIAKECVGGHVLLRNIPCGSKDIRCNKVCGKTRQCGMHSCERTCHPPPCEASSSRSVSGGLYVKETELRKDELNSEKFSNLSKESLEEGDLAKNSDDVIARKDTPSSLNAPFTCGLDSQTNSETDIIPSATSKSSVFRRGDRVRFTASVSGGLYPTSSTPSQLSSNLATTALESATIVQPYDTGWWTPEGYNSDEEQSIRGMVQRHILALYGMKHLATIMILEDKYREKVGMIVMTQLSTSETSYRDYHPFALL